MLIAFLVRDTNTWKENRIETNEQAAGDVAPDCWTFRRISPIRVATEIVKRITGGAHFKQLYLLLLLICLMPSINETNHDSILCRFLRGGINRKVREIGFIEQTGSCNTVISQNDFLLIAQLCSLFIRVYFAVLLPQEVNSN